jgi:hypothetical protein
MKLLINGLFLCAAVKEVLYDGQVNKEHHLPPAQQWHDRYVRALREPNSALKFEAVARLLDGLEQTASAVGVC